MSLPASHPFMQDIVRGHIGSSPMDLVAADGTALFFTADDSIAGRELWRSDGALGFLDARPDLGFGVSGGSGTSRVKDARPGKQGSDPLHLTWEPTKSLLFFSADDGSSGRELWSSDGTTAGTLMVADICPGVRGSGPSYLIAWGGSVYFQANDCTAGAELWMSDGTEVGTNMLADVRPGSAGAFPSYLTPLEPAAGGGERLFFLANGGGYDAAAAPGLTQGWGGAQLWVTDGTSEGTQRAFGQKTRGDFIPDRDSLDAGRPPRMAAFNGALYLSATEDPLVAVESLLGMHEVSERGISQVNDRVILKSSKPLLQYCSTRLAASKDFAPSQIPPPLIHLRFCRLPYHNGPTSVGFSEISGPDKHLSPCAMIPLWITSSSPLNAGDGGIRCRCRPRQCASGRTRV